MQHKTTIPQPESVPPGVHRGTAEQSVSVAVTPMVVMAVGFALGIYLADVCSGVGAYVAAAFVPIVGALPFVRRSVRRYAGQWSAVPLIALVRHSRFSPRGPSVPCTGTRPRAVPIYCIAVTPLAAMAGGYAYYTARIVRLPAHHIANLVGDERTLAQIEGVIVESPQSYESAPPHFERWYRHGQRTRVTIDARRIRAGDRWLPTTGVVDVWIGSPGLQFAVGQTVRATGRLNRPGPPRNPGQVDRRRRARHSGRLVSMSAKTEHNLVIIEAAAVDPAGRLHQWYRSAAANLLLAGERPLDHRARTLLQTMVLGRRQAIDTHLEDAFQRTGTGHYLAVSGFHVTVMCMLAWLVGRWLGLTPRTTSLVVIVVATLYLGMVDPRAPVLRATIVVYVVGVGLLLRRPWHAHNSLAVAAMIILIINPADVLTAGFQLSFVVLLGLYHLTGPMSNLLRRLILRQDELGTRIHVLHLDRNISPIVHAGVSVMMGCIAVCAVALAAYVAGLPLIAWHFGRVSPFGSLNSVLMSVPVSVTMYLAVVKMCVHMVLPVLGNVLAYPVEWAGSATIWLVAHLARLPLVATPVARPALVIIFAYLIWLLGPGLVPRLRVRRTKMYWTVGLAILAGHSASLAWTARHGRFTPREYCIINPGASATSGLAVRQTGTVKQDGGYSARPGDYVQVQVLAVGPGQAIWARTPHGAMMLFDAGSMYGSDVGGRSIVPALLENGVRRVHVAWISHANLDHFSALPTVAESLPVERVLTNGYMGYRAGEGTANRQLLLSLDGMVGQIRAAPAGSVIKVDDTVVCEVLWQPLNGVAREDMADFQANDTSLVVRMRAWGWSMLFTGDIDEAGQRALLAEGIDISADVLMLPHHGAVKKTTRQFIEAVGPAIVIRSGGHLSEGSRRRLEEVLRAVGIEPSAQMFDTARHGAITVRISGDNMAIGGYAMDNGVVVEKGR